MNDTLLDAVAGDLYGLLPAEFTAARAARVAEVRKAGDRQLAGEIGKLRRPTKGAWAVNILARGRGPQLEELTALGEALRAAQQRLAGGELRELSRRRHDLVAALAVEAQHLATEVGDPLNEAVTREVEQTLEAALADASIAAEVRAGRLTVALRYSGFGAVPDEGAEASVLASANEAVRKGTGAPADTAVPAAGSAVVGPGVARSVPAPSVPAPDGPGRAPADAGASPSAETDAADRRAAPAEAAAAAAAAALRHAEEEASMSRRILDERRRRSADAGARVERLAAERAAAERELTRLTEALTEARGAVDERNNELEQAQSALSRAEERLGTARRDAGGS